MRTALVLVIIAAFGVLGAIDIAAGNYPVGVASCLLGTANGLLLLGAA